MRVADFDFDLPAERIALRPAQPRDSAKLLVPGPDSFQDRIVRDLPKLLKPGDLLIFNDTKVMPAALTGRRIGRGDAEPRIEVLLHQRIDGSRFKAFAKPGKRLQAGDRIRFGDEGRVCFLGSLDATVEAKDEAEITLAFDFHGVTLDEAIAERGRMPLPPYIAGKRPADDQDFSDYQTMFARREGAVAAPTAGLHFTPELLDALERRGVARATVTLHVGPGTFRPVTAERVEEHSMAGEWYEVPPGTARALAKARAVGGRIVPMKR